MKTLLLIPAFAIGFIFAQYVQVGPRCGPAMQLTAFLQIRHTEHVVDEGHGELETGDALIWQVWTNDATETWTFTVKRPKTGEMCMVASGQNYDGELVPDMLKKHDMDLNGSRDQAA